MAAVWTFGCVLLIAHQALAGSASIRLRNAAAANALPMPVTGLGTGGYTGNSSQPYGSYPECFNGCADAECLVPNPANFSGCGEYVQAAVTTWLQLGGRRIDNSASYHNQYYVGVSIAASGIPRDQIFFVSKVGPYLPLGYADSKKQFDGILQTTNLAYVDLLLVHWPDCTTGGGCTGQPQSSEPACQFGTPTYNPKQCRLSTWQAMVEIFQAGGARAIGVSNYNQTHIQEIVEAGMLLPSVNQCPFNIYHSEVQYSLIDFCKSLNITFNGYSPFGVPDRRAFAPPLARTTLLDPVVVEIAAQHRRAPAEIMLAWQQAWGMVVNPRSMNAAHMLQNLAFSDIVLTADEVQQLNNRPQY